MSKGEIKELTAEVKAGERELGGVQGRIKGIERRRRKEAERKYEELFGVEEEEEKEEAVAIETVNDDDDDDDDEDGIGLGCLDIGEDDASASTSVTAAPSTIRLQNPQIPPTWTGKKPSELLNDVTLSFKDKKPTINSDSGVMTFGQNSVNLNDKEISPPCPPVSVLSTYSPS